MADTYFKIAAVAALPATGKTSLIKRFTTNDFSWLTGPTIGQDFKVHYVSVDNTRVKLQIWDMSSLRICRYMLSKILINCKGVILTYDISDKDSFLSANEMITIIKEHSEEAISIFVGLKCDLRDKREVPFWYAKKFADKHNMKYMETSAKTGENVVEVFVSLAEDLIYREKNKESQSSDEDEKATRLSRLPQMSHEKVDEELGLLGLETTEDLQEIMKLGTYRSYGNRIFLVGQFSVGKTTLSKVLIGEGLPKHRGATDGIWIHIGKAGMSLDDKKWLSFHTGSTNLDIVAGMLMSLQKQNSEGMHHGEQCLYSVESIKEVEKVIGIVNKIPKEAQTIQPSSEIPVIEERHAKSSVLPKTVKPTSYDNPNIQLQFSKLLSSNIPQWKLKDLIFKAINEGKYKQNIVFFDIWDFAGQKEFYMTHQLFMTSRGIFVLMFNACHSLRLENDSSIASHQEPSAAVYLVHWVNSILTYCKKSREGFPRILLVATHKDRIQKDKIESCRAKLIESLYQLFKSHAGLAHLEYKPLIFVNATDINDREIDLLRQCLIERASDHPRWGEEMPTAWIPLELQIAEQVELGNHIISKQQLEDLNSNNQSMVLSEKQINTFLKVQHSLGKLLYFDEVNLRDYIIINPVFLVEVLRSIITDKQFWPKEEKLLKIFRCLVETGTLERNDMYALWNQKEFIHIVPYREFMTDILVYLDILVAQHNPSEDGNHTPIGACNFFVPCMIKKPDNTKYMKTRCSLKNTIIMAYRFVEEVIPPALIYRFLASFATMWEVKIYKGSRMLFWDIVVVEVDENHDVAVQVKGKRVVVSLIHTEDVAHIVPTLASSVQECLTAAVHRVSEFYSLLSENGYPNAKYPSPFEIDFGVICEGLFRKSVCFFPHMDMPTAGKCTWVCPHGTSHEVNKLSLWYAEKNIESYVTGERHANKPVLCRLWCEFPHRRTSFVSCESCGENCGGLGRLELEQCPLDKHILRLVAEIEPYKCRDIIVNLGVTINTWENLEYQFQHQNPNDLKFMAVLKWKEENQDASFLQLQKALENCHINKHLLCQILRDSDPRLDIPKECLKNTPSMSVLRYISNHIGDSSLQLGIELGIYISEIKQIQHQFRDKLLDQTREILRRWKQNHSKPTVENLVKALFRIGKASCLKGVNFLFTCTIAEKSWMLFDKFFE